MDTEEALGTEFEAGDLGTADVEDSTAVTVDGSSATITRAIRGSNTCYTARHADAQITVQTVELEIVSFANAGEDRGCRSPSSVSSPKPSSMLPRVFSPSIAVFHSGELVASTTAS